jgi:hypothetical protein
VFILKKKNLHNQQANFNQTSTNHPLVKGIQNCLIKGPGPLQREEIIFEKSKME